VKKLFIGFVGVAVLLFSSFGCVTKKLWLNDIIVDEKKDKIVAFYSDIDLSTIIFAGEKYHYVIHKKFEGPQKRVYRGGYFAEEDVFDTYTIENNKKVFETLKTLKNDNIKSIKVKINNIETFRDSTKWIVMNINITLSANDIDIKDLGKLLIANKLDMAIDDKNNLSFKIDIYGQIYKADDKVNEKLEKLKEPYQINIRFLYTNKESTAYKVALTPLTVVADGGIIITVVVIGVVSIVVAPFYYLYDYLTD